MHWFVAGGCVVHGMIRLSERGGGVCIEVVGALIATHQATSSPASLLQLIEAVVDVTVRMREVRRARIILLGRQ